MKDLSSKIEWSNEVHEIMLHDCYVKCALVLIGNPRNKMTDDSMESSDMDLFRESLGSHVFLYVKRWRSPGRFSNVILALDTVGGLAICHRGSPRSEAPHPS